VTTSDGINVVLLSEVAWALSPVDAAAVLIGDLIIIISDLDHVSFPLVVHLSESWDSIWVSDPCMVVMVDSVDVVELEWALGPADTVILFAVLSEPLLFITNILMTDLGEVVSSWVCAVMSRFMVSAGSVSVHVLCSALKSEEVTWANNIINIVVSEEVLHIS
jgi:hypothetical protein